MGGFGQTLVFPGATPWARGAGVWARPRTGARRSVVAYPPGYQAPRVLQPIGNADAFNFLAETRWPSPADFPPSPAAPLPTACAPPSPDFYQPQYPGGPAWPGTTKTYPGGPVIRTGNGIVVSQPQLPAGDRGTVAMPGEVILGEPEMAPEMRAAATAALLPLAILGVIAWVATRKGRG